MDVTRALVALSVCCVGPCLRAAPPALDDYNVVWNSPSGDASGSMPIGNGTVGANVWVDQAGDIVLLISRTDSWSETDRLLKLGRVRITLDPNPFVGPAAGAGMTQTLRLREGRIEVAAGGAGQQTTVTVYAAEGLEQLRIEGASEQPVRVIAAAETWRTGRHALNDDDELASSWTMRAAPEDIRERHAWESADVMAVARDAGRDAIEWYHRNDHSVVAWTLDHQGLGPIREHFADPLIHRTFGARLEGDADGKAVPADAINTLDSRRPVNSFEFRITTRCEQAPTADVWLASLRRDASAAPPAVEVRAAHERWWKAFWDRSWIWIAGETPAATPALVPTNQHPLRLGADSNGQNVFRGRMRAVEVFRQPLPPDAIADVAANPRRNPDVGPIPWASWPGATRAIDAGEPLRFGSATLQPIGDAAPDLDDGEGPSLSFRGGRFEIGPDVSPSSPHGFSLAAQIRLDAHLGPARIFDKATAGSDDGFLFDTHPGDSLRLIVGPLIVHAKGVLKPGEWQHVAATYDSSTGQAALYLNGKAVATGGPRWADAPSPSPITRAYVLQRWMQACAGGPRDGTGRFPIKFNGSIFTVEPSHTQGQPHNADWRKWGGSFWWQNTRLPYHAMLAAGDFDLMDPLFRFYEDALPASRARTKLYYQSQGVYFPETMTSFATYANGDYGWSRDGLAPGDLSPCPWWQWAWNQSLELTHLMLDYAAYTGDEAFLRDRVLPMARETLLYFATRFKRDANGKLVISPTQAVETYWHEVVNDAPTVAGLHAVCDALLALPTTVGSPEDRSLWRRVKDAAPDLPVWQPNPDGPRMAAPAEKFKNQRNNVETAELYPLWPFRCYGRGRPGWDFAVQAFHHRVDKSTAGWTQDGLFAASLGLTDEARHQLIARAANSNPRHRFPAMWGPNFDWLPDQCHGSNLMTQVHLMLMQPTHDGRIKLLPAWPKEWDVSFKLHAPRRTIVELDWRGGELRTLRVTPESRRADIIEPSWADDNR